MLNLYSSHAPIIRFRTIAACALICLFLSAPLLPGAEREIRGSVFIPVVNGGLNFKLSLARVYLLSESQVKEMLTRNEGDLNGLLRNSEEAHLENERKKVLKHNALVDDLEKRRIATEDEISRVEERVTKLQGAAGAGGSQEARDLMVKRNELVKTYDAMKEEAERLRSGRPARQTWKQPPVEDAIEIMFRPPSGSEYATRTDSEGNFTLRSDGDYLLILTKEKNAKLKWFLKLSGMRKDGEKYLFTDENTIWSEDRAQVIEMKVTSDGYSFRRR